MGSTNLSNEELIKRISALESRVNESDSWRQNFEERQEASLKAMERRLEANIDLQQKRNQNSMDLLRNQLTDMTFGLLQTTMENMTSMRENGFYFYKITF